MTDKSRIEPKILIVSNQRKTGSIWTVALPQQTVKIVNETDPTRSLQRFEAESPDLLLLDVNLGNKAVLDLVKSLREVMYIPLIVLTKAHSDEFMLALYRAGVDDCIARTISPSLFQAKIMVWLRRSWSAGPGLFEPVKVGGIQLLPAEKSIVLDDRQAVRLTNLELRLLYNLMGRVGHPITVEELNQKIWGYSGEFDNTMIKNVVYRLRRKIEPDPAKPQIVQTVPGVGYMLIVE